MNNSTPEYILGISYGFVSTAVLIKDGEILSCVSEERFNGIKNYVGFPKESIEYCLRQAGIKPSELSLVTTPYTMLPPSHFSIERGNNSGRGVLGMFLYAAGFMRGLVKQVRYRFPVLGEVTYRAYRLAGKVIGGAYTRKQHSYIASYLKIDQNKIVSFDHHLSHAACGYFASPFGKKKALVLTLDGEGDNNSGGVFIFEKGRIRILARIPRESSLGYIYGYVTKFLGMKPHEHEYKVMGLAPYAKEIDIDRVYSRIKDHVYFDESRPLSFKTFIHSQDYELFLKDKMLEVRFDHLAGAYQKLLEEVVVKWVKNVIQTTGINTLVLSGGVFMNVKLNQKISEIPEVHELFVMPSCGDETAPIGSSYLGYLKLRSKSFEPKPISGLYWGPKASEKEIEDLLSTTGHKYERFEDIERKVAELLSQGYAVARMSGRMEFGARALGNRSIVASAVNPEIIKVINEQVKNRDFWMPFAPSILKERFTDYAVNPKNVDGSYMVMAFESTELARKELKAALHPYDETMRPQVVREDVNPSYHKILKEFEKITGIGGILNTSFNLHGFPIVLGPREAIQVFENSTLQYLVLENYLVTKNS